MTSGTGGNSGSGQHTGENKPEQPPALSKSHILTHLIEGFVIQEGNMPFPLERPSFSVDCLSLRRHRADMKTDSLPLKELRLQEPMLTCELCGQVDFTSAFKKSKRFCSTVCAKRYSVECSKKVGLFTNAKASIENMKKLSTLNGPLRSCPQETRRKKPAPVSCHSPQPAPGESSQCADLPYPGASSPLSPCHGLNMGSSTLSHSRLPPDPGQWNVDHVYDFICSLPDHYGNQTNHRLSPLFGGRLPVTLPGVGGCFSWLNPFFQPMMSEQVGAVWTSQRSSDRRRSMARLCCCLRRTTSWGP